MGDRNDPLSDVEQQMPAHPLIVTADPMILDDLVRLAAAARSPVRVAHDGHAARPDWEAAPFVLVGADAAESCVRVGPATRPDITVVARPGLELLPWTAVAELRAERVAVLPDADSWLVDLFAGQAPEARGRGQVLVVLGANPGAGATVLAMSLAVSAARQGLDALLVDTDMDGSGIEIALDWGRLADLRWPELVDGRGRLRPPGLMGVLPGEGSLGTASYDLPSVAQMATVIDNGRRRRDLVVVDLSSSLGPAGLLALDAADRGYLVVSGRARVADAAQRLAEAAARCQELRLVVRDLGDGQDAHGVARALELPLAGVVRPDHSVGVALAGGEPPAADGRGPLAQLCQELLGDTRPRRTRAGAR